MIAFLFIQPEAEVTYRIEEGIDGTERAGGTAERPCCDHHPDEEKEQDGYFQNEEPSQRGAKCRIQDDEGNACFQSSHGTELGKPGLKGQVGYDKNEDDQHKVFTIIQPSGNLSLGQFYLVEKVLEEAKGAGPAAGNPPADTANHGQESQGIEREMVRPVGNHKLKRTDRAGKQG